MKWIDTTDIRNWASRRDCQENLPQLVRKLIRATTNSIKSIQFPSGDNVLIGGWDGILEVLEETEYLPQGISLWEFGTSKDPKGKADDDYEKRSKNPLGFKPSECTFIFVTPQLWKKQNEWIEEKKKDGIWKDIRVIDAEILEEWLEIAPPVSAWLATQHLGKYPDSGIQSTDFFWEEWITGPSFRLIPEILLGGREKEIEELFRIVKTPSVVGIKDSSKEEALAFIIACFRSNSEREEDFFARSVIIKNSEVFRQLIVSHTPLILLPLFDDDSSFNLAVAKGHTVIVTLGIDSSDKWSNILLLPQIEREPFIEALTKIGILKEIAEKYSRETARNITILRRQLEFTRTIPEWAKPENARDIISALLIQQWDESNENDKSILALLARENYEKHSRKINRWRHTSDSPLIKIGNKWRLTSSLDAWTYASKNVTKSDFDLLRDSAIDILNEINPAFDLSSDQRHMALIYEKKLKYSDSIREGVIQSLILISVFGDNLKLDLLIRAELWVDRLLAQLLNNENPLFWKSIAGKLPLIAEASPNEFLKAVEKLFKVESSPIVDLFEEESGPFGSQAYHTGLLWALEQLAWMPEYFGRTAVFLAHLSAIDPGGTLMNRPINSLSEIFKPWHYQTLASFTERMDILNLIAKKEPEIAWILLIGMLPNPINTVAHPTHKNRWRMFNESYEKQITYQEIFNTHSAVVDLILLIFDFSELKLSTLVDTSINLYPIDRDKLLSFVESNLDKIKQIDFTTWHTLRNILSHHRSHPNTEWAYPESELERYEKLYHALAPSDDIQKVKWIFDEHWAQFPEGIERDNLSHEEQDKVVNTRRVEALKNIYTKYGIEKIKELAVEVKEPWVLGNTLGYILEDESEIFSLCEYLNEKGNKFIFIQSFIFRKSIIKSEEYIFYIFEKLQQNEFGDTVLGQLLVPLFKTQKLLKFVNTTKKEIKRIYWLETTPYLNNLDLDDIILGVKNLFEVKRFFSAVEACYYNKEILPSDLIIESLEKVVLEKANENNKLRGHEIERLFDTLDKREDIDQQRQINLEWLFLPILTSYSARRKPKLLHEELSKNPSFFIDVLKVIYQPDGSELVKEKRIELSTEETLNRAEQAYKLLNSWNKIPGVDNDGNIDSQFLWNWVNVVRESAIQIGRIKAADVYIGKILAKYPESTENWPPQEICEIIETVNTDSIKDNFSVTIFNKRGSSSRSPFEGGNRERILAKYFSDLSSQHKNKFPNVAAIFDKLSKGYEQDAKWEDERAAIEKLEY